MRSTNPLSRRTFLLASGVGLGATLAACSDNSGSSATGGSSSSGSSSSGGQSSNPATADSPSAQASPDSQVQQYRSRPDLRPATVMVQTDTGGAADGMLFLDTHAGPGQQGPMILDKHGKLVWFRALSDDATPDRRAFTVKAQTYRGQPVLTYFDGEVVSGHGEGHYVLCDQSYREIKRVTAHNGLQGDLHEFVITDRNTAVFTCYGTATDDKGSYFYGEVQEVDIATGKLVFSWRSDKHIGLDESYQTRDPSSTWDYLHINSIAIDTDDNFIVSSRNCWAIYKVDRHSGDVIWRMGGKKSDFDVPDEAHFAWQHHVRPRPNQIFTIFDNEAGSTHEAPQSRGLFLHVDQQARTVKFVRALTHNPPVLAGALGSVQPQANGNTLVGWGEPPWFTEYDPSGKVVFDARLAGDQTKDYRTFKAQWVGKPTDTPSIAVSGGATTTVHASWNGATEIARWRVLAGPSASALQPAGIFPKTGFETSMQLKDAPKQVAVEALDAGGAVLGRSATHAGTSG